MARSMQAGFIGLMLVMASMVLAQQKQEPATPQTPVAQPSQPAGAAPATDTAIAHLRIYRQRRYAGSALAPSIYIDDKQVARVGSGRRICIRLSPGPHSVRSDDKSSAISVDAKSGQDYFVRVDEEAGFWKGHGRLTMVLPEQGSAEYKLQKPVENDRKIARDMIEEDSEAPAKKN
jgi:hypothetical protein